MARLHEPGYSDDYIPLTLYRVCDQTDGLVLIRHKGQLFEIAYDDGGYEEELHAYVIEFDPEDEEEPLEPTITGQKE